MARQSPDFVTLQAVKSIRITIAMSTVIYPSPIFGPVHSRRLGVSLGINLMPADGKICTFDCIYCECGFNADRRPALPRPTRDEVREALTLRLEQMRREGPAPDVLTFAGNGEPTAHPEFAAIVDDVIALRDRFFPSARISVLSNATRAHLPEVKKALLRVDNNILKLDTVDPDYIRRVNRPAGAYDVHRVVETLAGYDGRLIVQTMFMRGSDAEGSVDNTSDRYVLPWLDAVRTIRPQAVMIYTIDRETPDHDLLKATHDDLDRIAALVQAAGIPCTVSY